MTMAKIYEELPFNQGLNGHKFPKGHIVHNTMPEEETGTLSL